MSQNQSHIYDCWNRIGVWGQKDERCPELDRVIHCRNCTVYSAAGRQLLNRSLSADYQNEWTDRLAKAQKKKHTNTESTFIFRAGLEWLALPVAVVREVADMGPIHSIPHRSSNTLRGIVNIKGKLEICVSIGAVLGIGRCESPRESKKYTAPTRLVVVKDDKQVLAFPVSEVMGVIRYRPEAVEEIPSPVSLAKTVYTIGSIRFDNKEISFLNYKQLFRSLTRDLV
jgi:chemotaxis-related protein WspD